jgi:hypothetical protein
LETEVEVDRFNLAEFTFTVERVNNTYFLVVRRKLIVEENHEDT